MTWHPPDLPAPARSSNEIGAVRDVILDGLIESKLDPMLVEVRDLESGTAPDLSPIGLEVAEEKSQQGRLAGAMRANHPDPVASLYDGREPADQGITAIGESHLPYVEHDAPGWIGDTADSRTLPGAACRSARCSRSSRSRRTRPLVPGAPGLDALANPKLFLGQLAIELRIGPGLDREDLVPAP